MAMAVHRSGGRLADGMVIAASVRAHLFGFKLLALDADITVSPEDAAGSEPRRIEAGRQASAGSENGSPPNPELQGGGLTEAALRLEAGAAELAAARERMP